MFLCAFTERQPSQTESIHSLTFEDFLQVRNVKAAERQAHFKQKCGRPKKKQAVSVSGLVFIIEISHFLMTGNCSTAPNSAKDILLFTVLV